MKNVAKNTNTNTNQMTEIEKFDLTNRVEWRLVSTGELHREDGPAIVWKNARIEEWYLNGLRHREDGPAMIFDNGSRYWFKHGVFHREDGPACEYADGTVLWYLNGKQLTRKKHQETIKRRELVE